MLGRIRISIRVTLSVLIGVLCCLFVTENLSGLVTSYRRYTSTREVAGLASIAEPLLTTLSASRRGHATTLVALTANDVVDKAGMDRIVSNRRFNDRFFDLLVERLGRIQQPRVAPMLATIVATHAALRTFDARVDFALSQPREARDPRLFKEWDNASLGWQEAQVAADDFVNHAIQHVDPTLNWLLSVKQAAWSMRLAAGQEILASYLAVASGAAWSWKQVATNAEVRLRRDAAWADLLKAAARPEIPPRLASAIERIRTEYFAFLNGQQKPVLDSLMSGHAVTIPYRQFEAAQGVAAEAITDAAITADQELVARADRQAMEAKQTFIFDAVFTLFALLLSGIGIFISYRRISAPIIGMAATMRRLAKRDISVVIPGLGRRDEIGAMAAAVAVFRDAIAEAETLAALAEQQKAAESARAEAAAAEIAAMAALQGEVVETMVYGLTQLAEGNLAFNLPLPLAPQYEMLRTLFNDAVAGLQATVRNVMQHSHTIASSTKEIANSADDLANRTSQQAASLQQTTRALEAITTGVRQTASGSARAQGLAETSKAVAAQSVIVVQQTVAAMTAIDESAEKIGQTIGLIDEIALQTNLLSLNASIEAAHVGEAGRGFALVASEIRTLAQRAAEAAKEIKSLVGTSTQNIGRGVHFVDQTGQALERIQQGVANIAEAIRKIAAGAQAQSASLAEISDTFTEMDRVTQQNVAMVEQSTAATHTLAQETDALNQTVERFKIAEAA